jgi:hypothetical protein
MMTTTQKPAAEAATAHLLPDFVTDRTSQVVAGAWENLERLLDDELCYVHATGARHNKQEYLKFVKERIRIVAIEVQDAKVWRTDEAVVITGLLVQTIVRSGEVNSVEVRSWITEIWKKRTDWKLYAFQSTRQIDA